MAQARKKRDRGAGSRRTEPTQAERADPLELYQTAVQAPKVDVHFFTELFWSVFDEEPLHLREDFCGAAAVCAAWVESSIDREAWGVDIDPAPLAWGLEHNIAPLGEASAERVHLVEGDVRVAQTPRVDIVCAQNFSYCVFQRRDELLRYFRRCRDGLDERGLLITDLFGGYESIEDEKEEVTAHSGFDYVWEQHRFDPINARGIYKIHFRFPDKSELRDAFIYDWRLWTIPEVREVMIEAGFERADVYWEDEDPKTGEGTGTFSLQTTGASDPAWNAYIIGVLGAE